MKSLSYASTTDVAPTGPIESQWEVHDGTWLQRWDQRDRAQQTYYAKHPERFRRRLSTPAPAGILGINLPKDDTKRLHAA